MIQLTMFGEAFSRASFSHLASWTNVSRLEEGQREKERKRERERERAECGEEETRVSSLPGSSPQPTWYKVQS